MKKENNRVFRLKTYKKNIVISYFLIVLKYINALERPWPYDMLVHSHPTSLYIDDEACYRAYSSRVIVGYMCVAKLDLAYTCLDSFKNVIPLFCFSCKFG